MKARTVLKWGGPAAIVGGVFTMFSDLLNLTIYVPGLGEAAHTGYQAVGSGVILFALMLLLVGMGGLYARSIPADGARTIEYGDAHARYILVEEDHDLTEVETRERGQRQPSLELRSADVHRLAARRHQTLTTTSRA